MMRRFLSCLLLLPLCLCACSDKETIGDKAPTSLAAEVIEAISEEEDFSPADADYIENCYDFSPMPLAGAVYFGEAQGVEFGIFAFESAKDAARAEEALLAYLAREEEAVRSLAALYPADELEERLARYAAAKVVREEGYCAYFLLSDAACTAALAAYQHALHA